MPSKLMFTPHKTYQQTSASTSDTSYLLDKETMDDRPSQKMGPSFAGESKWVRVIDLVEEGGQIERKTRFHRKTKQGMNELDYQAMGEE